MGGIDRRKAVHCECLVRKTEPTIRTVATQRDCRRQPDRSERLRSRACRVARHNHEQEASAAGSMPGLSKGWILPAILLAFLFSAHDGVLAQGQQRQAAPMGATNFDSSPLRLRIGDSAFDVPRNALFGGYGHTPQQRALLMRILYPQLEVRTRENQLEMQKVRQDSRVIQVLVEDHSLLPRPITGKEYVNNVFKFEVTSQERRADISHQTSDTLGLDHFFVRKLTSREEHDVFVDKIDQPQDRDFVIVCTRPGDPPANVPNPYCSLYAAYRNLSVKMSFVRALLPEWRLIRDRVVDWMDKIRVRER